MYSYKEMFEDNNIKVAALSDKYLDIKGEPFITLTSGGVKEQGSAVPVLFADKETASKAFEDTFLTWLNGRRVIYLRMVPEMREETFMQDSLHDEFSKRVYYYVVCRLTAY
jgi:hypothetical protein